MLYVYIYLCSVCAMLYVYIYLCSVCAMLYLYIYLCSVCAMLYVYTYLCSVCAMHIVCGMSREGYNPPFYNFPMYCTYVLRNLIFSHIGERHLFREIVIRTDTMLTNNML